MIKVLLIAGILCSCLTSKPTANSKIELRSTDCSMHYSISLDETYFERISSDQEILSYEDGQQLASLLRKCKIAEESRLPDYRIIIYEIRDGQRAVIGGMDGNGTFYRDGQAVLCTNEATTIIKKYTDSDCFAN